MDEKDKADMAADGAAKTKKKKKKKKKAPEEAAGLVSDGHNTRTAERIDGTFAIVLPDWSISNHMLQSFCSLHMFVTESHHPV